MRTHLHGICLIVLLAAPLTAQEGRRSPAAMAMAQMEKEYEAQNYVGAVELCRDIIRKYPTDDAVQGGAVQLRLIWGLFNADLVDEAGAEAKKFVESFPEHRAVASAYYILGMWYERLHEAGAGREKAREAFLKALETERNPDQIKAIKARIEDLDRNVAYDAREKRDLVQSNPDRVVIINDPLPSEEGLPRKQDLGRYVILTDVPENDPYYEAVDRLAKLRKAERILRFVPDKLGDLAEMLKQVGPEFVCVVTKPETPDENFATRLFELSAKLDSDPFPDFLYGVVTGGTAAEAVQFVKNISRVEKARTPFPKKILRVTKSSSSDLRTDVFEWVTGFSTLSVSYANNSFLRSHYDAFKGNGLVVIRSYSALDDRREFIQPADIAAVDLFPAVVFNSLHHGGAVCRTLITDAQSYKIVAKAIDPAQSFCLRVIGSGATAYLAPIGSPRQTACAQEVEKLLLSGECLGQVIKYTYDGIVLARGEAVPAFQLLIPGQSRPVETSLDSDIRATVTRILYGDPAYKPLSTGVGGPPKISSKRRVNVLKCTYQRSDPDGENLFLDGYRFGLESRDKSSNSQVRLAVELPKGVDKDVRKITIEPPPSAQVRMKPAFVTCIHEKWGGKKLLHIQVDFPPGSIRSKDFALDISLELEK